MVLEKDAPKCHKKAAGHCAWQKIWNSVRPFVTSKKLFLKLHPKLL